mgnify:CR=1 FL=1
MAEVHEPQRIEPTKLGDYLEVMTKAVFQSGISWVKDLRKQFKLMGESGSYYFLYVVGEEVPSYEGWSAAQAR